ncbi:MAG: amino acid ABC transporter permease, partial [Bacillati bacterium ANGP1]
MLHDLSFALPQLLRGLGVTLEIGAIVILAGSLAGFVVGLSLLYGGFVVRLAARVYVDTVRGLPVLVLIFAIYFALPAFGLRFSAFQAGVTALSIFAAAHIAEIVRGGVDSIPGAQVDAAKAVGLTFWQRLRLVILPQAVRRMVPPWVNVAVEIVKG